MTIEKINKILQTKLKGIVYQVDTDNVHLSNKLVGYFIDNTDTNAEVSFITSCDVGMFIEEFEDLEYDKKQLLETIETIEKKLQETEKELKNEVLDKHNNAVSLFEDFLRDFVKEHEITISNSEINYYVKQFNKEL